MPLPLPSVTLKALPLKSITKVLPANGPVCWASTKLVVSRLVGAVPVVLPVVPEVVVPEVVEPSVVPVVPDVVVPEVVVPSVVPVVPEVVVPEVVVPSVVPSVVPVVPEVVVP